ncbi:alpha-amylase family glycosyl hydrolase [Candidatus Saccharibacteria bacterium]|nr:alpha-amylase family glycosyl hydrolase [Candidatus Saccharibacteria bacterium]
MSKSNLKILEVDPLLRPYARHIERRMAKYEKARGVAALLSDVANGHMFYGFHETDDGRGKKGWVYREWAPGAEAMALVGDFNDWNDQTHQMKRGENGNWELAVDGEIPHESRVKVRVAKGGRTLERIPLYARRAVQCEQTKNFDGVIWCPAKEYVWKNKAPKRAAKTPLHIYECHVGMSGEEARVSTFLEFTEKVLPRIKRLGYNAIQVMAVQEHPYYGSFGYQVSNFFAVSSRFGTPDEFKALVDAAHGMGIAVIMDLVHSHMVKNTAEGPAEFDGTDYMLTHSGEKGTHSAWGTRLFDYGKSEVQHFLLSNIKYWLTEYRLDGFRFDGVTSMLYHHHGLEEAFDHYDKYFTMATDEEAITYLQLATSLAREVNPEVILIAEDMSGMPGMCRPVAEGGIGFTYRLNMGLPDFFINLVQKPDHYWSVKALWHELTTRRAGEKTIGYTESHDQALVGDKTLMFWLADEEMYWAMDKGSASWRVDRAMALHKMLRLIVGAAGGDGYLNFMGNEFGHPEWIDFPREGNGWSYQYARRQWSLADNSFLRYEYLEKFDEAMLSLLSSSGLARFETEVIKVAETPKIIAFRKGGYVLVFNFHWARASAVALDGISGAKLVLHSNWRRFGGNVDEKTNIGVLRKNGLMMAPRSAVVLKV